MIGSSIPDVGHISEITGSAPSVMQVQLSFDLYHIDLSLVS
jgi:hypothetical protein